MNNSTFISNEMEWMSRLVVARLNSYFNSLKNEAEPQETLDITIIPAQEVLPGCPYSDFILMHSLDIADRLYLALAIAPFVKPQLFDCLCIKNSTTGGRFVEFGGVQGNDENMFIPTLETFLFILAGDNTEAKLALRKQYTSHPVLNGVLFNNRAIREGIDRTITPSLELVEQIVHCRPYTPSFTTDFPARKITTSREWTDLVLDDSTLQQLSMIRKWIEYGDTLMNEWGMKGILKKGYRALFHGPSGTGKTFSVSLLGKYTGKDVYCVDLSMVVSKYIGETEKNLSKVFDIAEGKGWILFFDEADALFGKRTGVKDSHDKYANQEIAFLLQRIEDYDGLVVLSTNLRSNLDEAFARRFQNIIKFSLPDKVQREKLWRNTFPKNVTFEAAVDIERIAASYELSGGAILNVVQYCSLQALSKGTCVITEEDLREGIRLEYAKQGKIAN